MERVHIDIETYSDVDLTKVGLHRYASHPSTRIELAAWAVGSGPVQQWDINDGGEIPAGLVYILMHPNEYEYHAFNAPFERALFEGVWKIRCSAEYWHCTMIHSWSLGFSGSLGKVGAQMEISPDKKKLADGHTLVLMFCKPAPKGHNAYRYNKDNKPEQWERYRVYNRQDVEAERQIKSLCDPYPIHAAERAFYLLDQKINARGLPIDEQLVNIAASFDVAEKAEMKGLMNRLTGLGNANSIKQLAPWLLEHYNITLPNLQAATLKSFLKRFTTLPDVVREVLELRQQVSKTSTKKYAVISQCVHHGRLHGTFQFAGAQRTQRWAGRMFQPHNMKRGFPDADVQAELLMSNDIKLLRILVGNVIDFISNIMRAVVTAPPNKMLCVSDYGSIESRVLGYISGCHRINNLFLNGQDSYKDFATEVYNVQYADVTKDQRGFCKPPVLGCGYQLGAKGLVKYAEGMGVRMSVIEAARLVRLWRDLYPEVVYMWDWLTGACKHVIAKGGRVTGYCVTIYRDDKFLFIKLPGGRSLAYFKPAVKQEVPPWENEKARKEAKEGRVYIPKTLPTVTYMGMDQYTNKWTRITTHGGKITENIVQAIARDILCDGMYQMDLHHQDIIGHVHDEVIIEQDEAYAEGTLQQMNQIMSTPPHWAPGMLLGAEGFITKRYRKG